MTELKALQNKEIEIMRYVDAACEKLGISYVIMYGTLLGAVRHQGFIPWDDDMDICMLREDYDKFIAEGDKYLPEHIRIQHCLTEEECPNIFAKVRDSNTTFLAAEHVDLNINHGVFIDVFPVDYVSSVPIAYQWESFRRRLFQTVNNCYDMAYVNTIHRKFSRLIAHCIRGLIIGGVLRGKTRREFILREDRRRAAIKPDSSHTLLLTEDFSTICSMSVFKDRARYTFEEEKFWGPKDYDQVLSDYYGDYMTLPPEDQRVTHKPMEVDLAHGRNAAKG